MQKQQLIEQMRALMFLGAVIVPVRLNKKPILRNWTDDDFLLSEEEIVSYIERGAQIGIVTGKRSGITVVDIDFRIPDVYGTDPDIFPGTYTVRTPSGAIQKYYQFDERIPQSQKGFEKYPCVDIRNQGGQVVSPPSIAKYTKHYKDGEKDIYKNIDGQYTVLSGTWASMAPFPYELFEDIVKPKVIIGDHKPHEFKMRPGDDFEKTTPWEHILQPQGWVRGHTDPKGSTHWTRPGKKDDSTGATTRVCDDGRERLFVFSTSAQPLVAYDPLQHNSYTKISAYATLNHSGDFKNAVRALREQGYGVPQSSEQSEQENQTPEQTEPEKPLFTSLTDLLNKEFPPYKFALEPFFETNAINMVSAPPNNWKSWTLFDIALSIASGKKWLDTFEVDKQRVLIINEEDTEQSVQQRMKLLEADNREADVLFMVMTGFKLDTEMANKIIAECKKENITLVMFDSLRAIHNENENDSTPMQKVMDNFKLFVRAGITVVFTHHHKKKMQKDGDKIDDSETTRGSTAINAAVSGHISLEEEKREPDIFIVVKHLKSKATAKLKPFDVKVKVETDQSVEFEYADMHVSNFLAFQLAREKILKELLDQPDRWWSYTDLQSLTDKSERNVRSALRELEDKSLVLTSTREKLGIDAVGPGKKNAKFYKYRPIEDADEFMNKWGKD